MSKYIDADKLIAEIERREIILDKYKDSFEEAACCKQELVWLKDFISSLQQKQPEVEFEKEYAKFSNEPEADFAFPIDLADYKDFARHFFELGLNARKEE